MKINKKILTVILGTLFILGIMFSLYLSNIGFKIEDLAEYTKDNFFIIVFGSLFIFSIRIFLFIPISILIITLGTIIDNVLLTFLISIIGVFIGVLQTYYIGFLINSDLKGNRFVKKIEHYTVKIKEKGFIYIFFGSMLPLIPVDLIYYAAGFEKYNILRFIIASFLGSIPIVFIYSYLGSQSYLLMQNINYIAVIILILIIIYFIFKKGFKKN